MDCLYLYWHITSNYWIFCLFCDLYSFKVTSPTKAPKKKHGDAAYLSKAIVSDSANTDEDEIIDYSNGHDLSLDGQTESITSEAGSSNVHSHDESSSNTFNQWIFLLILLPIVGWHSQDDRTLVEKVKSISKANDRVSFKARLKHFDWNKIAFQNYSAKECEDRFNTLMKCVRQHRNLNEIAVDIETTMTKSKLKKPLNSYQLFVQDQLSKVTTTGDFVSDFVPWTEISVFDVQPFIRDFFSTFL